MSFYTEVGADARELLTEFGQPGTLKVRTGLHYDVSIGQAAVDESEYSCVAIVFPVDTKEIDNTLVKRGDLSAILSLTITKEQLDSLTSDDFDSYTTFWNFTNPVGDSSYGLNENVVNFPNPGDSLILGIRRYSIISVKQYDPAGTTILFELIIRR